MKQACSKYVLLVVCLLLLAVANASAQTLDRGAVHGFVYDTSGAAIPGAKVTLTTPATGLTRELVTNSDGGYDFEALTPGEYTLTIAAGNFASYTIKQIVVSIGSSIALDAHLRVKAAEQSVTVTAEAAGAVDTTTSGITQLLDQRDLENLPFPGRDYRDLAQLSPSAQVVPGLRGAIRLGGQQSDYNGLVIDGADTTNNFFGENFGSLETKNLTVPIEAVQEFQVVTNGFAPEFGRATGGLLNVITKSGTNDLHGEAHEYFRSGSLTKDDALGAPPNIDKQNQFGGSAGFPIHKDRQWLFLSTDIQRSHGPLTTNLCGKTDTACQNDAGPVIPIAANNTDKLGPSCKNVTPGTTHLLPGCYGVANLHALEGSSTQFQNFFTLLGHYDYQLTTANHFSIRGFGTRNHTKGFTGGHGQSETFDAFGDTEDFINQGISGVFSLTTVLGRKVNEVRALIEGETRKRHPIFSGAPEIFIGGVGEFGQRFYLPGNNDNGKLQVQDNFSYSFAKHDVKFGGDVDAFVDRKDIFAGWSAGRYNYGSLTDFDNSNPNFYFQGFGLHGLDVFKAGTIKPAYQTGIGLYAQDKWQARPRLTVTYGLRWDGTRNPQTQTVITGQKVFVGVGAGSHLVPVPQKVPNDYEQWGPRVGVAWNVAGTSHPTTIRAAWGFYYAQSPTIFFPTAGSENSQTLFCPTRFGCNPSSGAPYTFPSTLPITVDQMCTSPQSTIGCPSISYVDPAFKNPRVSNLTVGVEHQIANNWTVGVNYAFMYSWRLKTGGFSTSNWQRNFVSLGTDSLGRSILASEPGGVGTCPANGATVFGALPADCTLSVFGVNSLASFSHGTYHAVTASVNKRFSNRYQWFANYTWSRNYSNDSSERDTDTFFGTQDPFNINIDYGRNGLDISHQFKSGIVVDLPHGFNWSSNFIAHSGLAYPAYITGDINGDGVVNQFSNNDRPGVQIGSGKPFLMPRYPARQPDFFTWDMRISKDIKLGERYQFRLTADLYNVTNRGNLYSNPDNTGFISLPGATTTPITGPTAGCTPIPNSISLSCPALTAIPKQGDTFTLINPTPGGQNVTFKYGVHDEISPGSTPFAAQFGVRFQF
ncbi:MAG TPA: carboxypeptidase regulatory-like domain-containing protein [Candidatus Acidoferrum sp.]|nr:carboxypeptidase regulatory-like domain-containing protein [Candidatus Acidoferrum sp.]